MIDIEKSPSSISLAGNPISFTIKGRKALGSGSKLGAYAKIDFSREIRTLDEFYISVNGTIFTFYVLGYGSSSDDDVRFITIPDGASSMDVVGIAKHLNRHPDLRKNFSFTPDSENEEVRMMANNLERYEIDAASSGDGDLAVSCTQILHGGAASVRENYMMHERIYLPDIAPDNPIAEILLSPDNEGRNSNDIGEFLHPYFSLDLHISPTEIVYEQPKLLLRYQAEFWESYTDFISLITASSDDLWALPGRRSALALVKDNNDSFVWLSNFNGIKTVYPGYPEKLFYIAEPGYTYQVILNHDGSRVILSEISEPSSKTVLEINVSPSLIQSFTGLSLVDYSITVHKNKISHEPGIIGYYAPPKEYHVSPAPANLKVFIFINAYGVPETAYMTGTKTRNLKISRDILQIEGAEAADRPLMARVNHDIKVGSGFIDRSTWIWLCEMQRSLQVYEIIREENILLACVMTNSQSREFSDSDLYAHEFEYSYAREGSIRFETPSTLSFIFDNTFDNTYN